jgi:hypothetical protein
MSVTPSPAEGIPYRRYRVFVFVLSAALGVACLVQLLFGNTASFGDKAGHAWGADDAYISYRYARNAALGRGLVYNSSDERVEGYSNLLYVILLVPAAAISPKAVFPWATALNIASVLLALLLFTRHVRKRAGDVAALFAGSVFVLWPQLWTWAASGMETAVVLLFQIAIWVSADEALERRSPADAARTGVLMSGLCLLRVDGFTTAAAVLLCFGLSRWWKGLGLAAALVGVTMGSVTLWRLYYYGYPLPNTYYVKVAGAVMERVKAGIHQVVAGSTFTGLLACGFLAAVDFFYSLWRPPSSVLAGTSSQLTGCITLVILASWFLNGGDVFDERFLLILLPLGVFSLLRALQGTSMRLQLEVVGLLVVLQLPPLMGVQHRFETHKYDRWMTLGNFLGRTHSGALLAVDAAGKVPYFSGLTTIDMLGLNDKFIGHKPTTAFGLVGHTKYDSDYVLSRRPDLIAGWILPNLDMGLDLDRVRLQAAGYRLRYLVHYDRDDGEPIRDVNNLNDGVIKRLYQQGFTYGVFEKTSDSVGSAPSPRNTGAAVGGRTPRCNRSGHRIHLSKMSTEPAQVESLIPSV